MNGERARARRRPPRSGAPSLEGYDGLRLVGKGGFSRVYRAWQSGFNREVAVKVLSRQAVDSRAYRLFDRERSALGTLSSHPNIVTVYDSGQTSDGALYLVMEYVPGGSLADRLAEGPGDWREALRIGIKLAGALETAHRAGVLHRDIKPENVLLSEFGEPQLADFGIARLQAGSTQTRSMEIKLSIPFSSPELLDGAEPSVRSDVYALACTLHSFVLGRPSFLSTRSRENSLMALMVRIHGEPAPDLRPFGVPDALCRVLERAMAKEGDRRHSSALELGRELQGAEAAIGLSPTVLPVPGASQRREVRVPAAMPEAWQATPRVAPAPPAPARKAARRRRPVVGVLALLVVLAAAGSAAWMVAGGEGNGSGVPPTTTVPPVALPASTRPIPAGFYFLPDFEPSTTFRLEEGWRRPRHDRPFLVELQPVGDRNSLVSIFTVADVVDPGRTYPSLAAARERGAAVPAPDDIVEWLTDHPTLKVSPAGEVSAAGLEGQRLDLSLRSTNAVCGRGPEECSVLFHFGRGTVFVLLPENRNRLYVFRTGGRTVVVTVEARPDRFDEVAAATERILPTMEIGLTASG